MATGLPARMVVLCAVLLTAQQAIAQAPPDASGGDAPDADRPPLTSPTAQPPAAGPPSPQPTAERALERRQVAVIDLSTDPAAETLADALFNILGNHPDLRPLSKPNLVVALKGPFADEDGQALNRARTARTEASDALVQLDYRSAELAAERGIAALHNVRATPEALGLYAELAFAAGQAALKLRKPNDASLLFGLSHRLDSGKRPDPARYEPDIVHAYDLAVTKIPVPAPLEVKGTGTVWIDGIDRGPPGTFEVSHGLHLVQLSGADRDTRGRQVAIPATTAVEIEAAPASDERKVARARNELASTRDAAARAGAIKKLAALLGVDDVVLIDKGDAGALRVQTWRNRDGFSAWVTHRGEQPGDLLVPLAPPRPVVDEAPREVIPIAPPPVETPFYRKRWVQVLGVAAGVVAAGFAYSLATQDRSLEFPGNVQEAE